MSVNMAIVGMKLKRKPFKNIFRGFLSLMRLRIRAMNGARQMKPFKALRSRPRLKVMDRVFRRVISCGRLLTTTSKKNRYIQKRRSQAAIYPNIMPKKPTIVMEASINTFLSII